MATKSQQYTGRLYTQAEVDRMLREARIKETKLWYNDWGMSDETIGDGSWEDFYEYRIAELSKEDV